MLPAPGQGGLQLLVVVLLAPGAHFRIQLFQGLVRLFASLEVLARKTSVQQLLLAPTRSLAHCQTDPVLDAIFDGEARLLELRNGVAGEGEFLGAVFSCLDLSRRVTAFQAFVDINTNALAVCTVEFGVLDGQTSSGEVLRGEAHPFQQLIPVPLLLPLHLPHVCDLELLAVSKVASLAPVIDVSLDVFAPEFFQFCFLQPISRTGISCANARLEHPFLNDVDQIAGHLPNYLRLFSEHGVIDHRVFPAFVL
mmetsp:Transcript_8963/g.16261  ORF Transcript_8963/g.16261 Transcript_8963/m.16261 type:complete len:252 (+) Transcript_8963:764-1519(+)